MGGRNEPRGVGPKCTQGSLDLSADKRLGEVWSGRSSLPSFCNACCSQRSLFQAFASRSYTCVYNLVGCPAGIVRSPGRQLKTRQGWQTTRLDQTFSTGWLATPL